MSGLALDGAKPILDGSRHRRWPIVGQAEREAVARVLDRGVLSGASAPESIAFEDEFAAWVGAKHCLLTHSGTSALHLALAASGVRAGDHVIVPAYSFVATAHAVLHAGAIPIFVDVDRATGLLDVEAAKAAVTSRTRAIVPVHVHGLPADLAALVPWAKRQGVAVVEDAAQAHGATFGGQPVGAIGSAGAFSLQSSKNLSAGEGGLFVTNDDGLAESANRLRSFGQDAPLAERRAFDGVRPLDGARPLVAEGIGWMYRGSEMMAAFARAQLAALPDRTLRCQRNAERLSRALAEIPSVLPPEVPEGRTSVHHKFRVRLDPRAIGVTAPEAVWRDVVADALRAEGLEVVAWQTTILPSHPAFVSRVGWGDGWPWSTDRETDFSSAYDPAAFPNARALLDGSIVLFSQSCPLIAQDDDVVDGYVEAFRRCFRHVADLIRAAKARATGC